MSESNGTAVGTRGFELGVALFLALLAALVIGDSVRVGTGWADDGPRAGYFPFYIGCGLLVASGWIALRQLLHWRGPDPAFTEAGALRQVASVLLPMVLYVALIAGIGIYVASALLIGWFMRRHGQYGWAATLGVSIGVPLVFFLVFERWFLVPLPKGPLEQLLGF